MPGWPVLQNLSGYPSATELTHPSRALRYQQFRPTMSYRRAATNFSVANSTWTFLGFDAEEKDSEGGHSTDANTERFVAQTAGYYWVQLLVSWDGNTTGGRIICLTKNQTVASGSLPFCGNTKTGASLYSGGWQIQRCKGVVQLNAGDWISVEAWQDSGGARGGSGILYPFSSYAKLQGFLVCK